MAKRVLFPCTGNSARSQMAEAFLRKYGGDRYEAYGAGIEPKEIHPYTRLVMREVGLDLAGQQAKHVDEYAGKMSFDFVITLCAEAEAACPLWPGVGQRIHWPFDDPAGAAGTAAEKLEKGRRVRDQIEEQIRAWLAEQEEVSSDG